MVEEPLVREVQPTVESASKGAVVLTWPASYSWCVRRLKLAVIVVTVVGVAIVCLVKSIVVTVRTGAVMPPSLELPSWSVLRLRLVVIVMTVAHAALVGVVSVSRPMVWKVA